MTNRTVLITGATKGIGLAVSQCLAERGWQVVGIARQVAKETFPGVLFYGDLSNTEVTTKLLNEIAQNYTIDAVVNNIGMTMSAFRYLGDLDLNELQTLWHVNVRTTVQVTQALVVAMKRQHWGRIINITSRATSGIKGLGNYAAAKSALLGLTKTWALELAELGVTVNAISPGAIETEMFRQKHSVGNDAEQRMLDTIPMKRIGKPTEIAVAVDFLLSDDAGFITGQTLCIDGGNSIM